MKDRPILFSAPMIRAILDGRKTQTRRVLDAWCDEPPAFVEDGVVTAFDENHRPYRWPKTNAIGDRLWVREAWAPLSTLIHNDPGAQALADRGFYRADNSTVDGEISRWRPSIHMPRWASRITLPVTDVRVQRLQDISEADAIAEGIELVKVTKQWGNHWRNYGADGMTDRSAKYSFQTLWTSINGHKKMVSWNDNPWVAAYTFNPIIRNIDRIAEAT